MLESGRGLSEDLSTSRWFGFYRFLQLIFGDFYCRFYVLNKKKEPFPNFISIPGHDAGQEVLES